MLKNLTKQPLKNRQKEKHQPGLDERTGVEKQPAEVLKVSGKCHDCMKIYLFHDNDHDPQHHNSYFNHYNHHNWS